MYQSIKSLPPSFDGSALFISACVVFLVACSHSYLATPTWEKYRGAWFEIEYPANFKVIPSLPSYSTDGFDSALFESPDGKVRFYVFSPQWSGEPKDFKFDPQNEILVSQSRDSNKQSEINRFTVKAMDGSYFRAMEETKEKDINVSYAFGIKYNDMNSYNKYKSMYLKFKRSINRYAD